MSVYPQRRRKSALTAATRAHVCCRNAGPTPSARVGTGIGIRIHGAAHGLLRPKVAPEKFIEPVALRG